MSQLHRQCKFSAECRVHTFQGILHGLIKYANLGCSQQHCLHNMLSILQSVAVKTFYAVCLYHTFSHASGDCPSPQADCFAVSQKLVLSVTVGPVVASSSDTFNTAPHDCLAHRLVHVLLCRLQSRHPEADDQQQHGLQARNSSSRSDVLRQSFNSSQASAGLPDSASTNPVANSPGPAPNAAWALASMSSKPTSGGLVSDSQLMHAHTRPASSEGPTSTPSLRVTPTQLAPLTVASTPADPLRPSSGGHSHNQSNDSTRLNSSVFARPDSTAAATLASPPRSGDIAELQKQLQQLHSRQGKQQQTESQQQHRQSGHVGVNTTPSTSNSHDAERSLALGQTQQGSQQRQLEGRVASRSPSDEASMGSGLPAVRAQQQQLQQHQSLQRRSASPMGQSHFSAEAGLKDSMSASRTRSPSVEAGDVRSKPNIDLTAGRSFVVQAAAPDLLRASPAAQHRSMLPPQNSDKPHLLDRPRASPHPQPGMLAAANRASPSPQPRAPPPGRTGLSPEKSRASPVRASSPSQAVPSSALGVGHLASQLRASPPVQQRASPAPIAGLPPPHAEQALLEPHQV